ncbi:MAG: hypothetical protein IKT00_11125 [Prevotella sp.]|nr:hypothetical protein [Prevotella sp.]
MEKKDWHIVPECYIDTNLAEFLLDSHGVNHQKGCNAVAKKMMESNLKDQFSIGIIDNDKRQHSYVSEFTEIAHTQHVTLLKHKERPHYFVRISPAMDQFLLDCAAEQGLNLQDYGLPSDLSEFTKITKDVKAKNDYRFKSLFGALKDSKELSKLRSVINYMNDKQYKCDATELKMMFEG